MCIRDRSTWGYLSPMHKPNDCERNYKNLKGRKAISVFNQNLRGDPLKVDDETVKIWKMSTISRNKEQDMIKDLHNLLTPIVSNIRGQSGMFQSIKAFTFKQVGRTRKRSFQSSSLRIILFQDELSKDCQFLSDKPESFKQIEAFEVFLSDFVDMLKNRSLDFIDLFGIRKNEYLRFWIQEPLLKSSLDTSFSIFTEFDPMEIAASVAIRKNIANSLAFEEVNTKKWFESQLELSEKYPIPFHRLLPSKRFNTRKNGFLGKLPIYCQSRF
eukprot:TRINITY_DN10871_c0_g1_i2.p1 TRINITY_DN10871_c0_g1~~TRINITY_DN10871_c0_g1_i2.p1  ORF type:complete len:270 (+),score=29.27 TRINITY_DN10871_c0_g1_i2:79-888(+)